MRSNVNVDTYHISQSIGAISRIITACDIVFNVMHVIGSLIGNKIETRTLEYKVVGNVLHIPQQALTHNKHLTHSR